MSETNKAPADVERAWPSEAEIQRMARDALRRAWDNYLFDLREVVAPRLADELRAGFAASAAERERLPEVERLAEHVRTCADIAQFCRDLYQQSDGLGGPASYVNGTLLGILQRLAQMIMQAEIRTAELQRESSAALSSGQGEEGPG